MKEVSGYHLLMIFVDLELRRNLANLIPCWGTLPHILEDMTTNVVSKQKKKEEQDRSKGLAMRKAAMETYASMSTRHDCCCLNDDDFSS